MERRRGGALQRLRHRAADPMADLIAVSPRLGNHRPHAAPQDLTRSRANDLGLCRPTRSGSGPDILQRC